MIIYYPLIDAIVQKRLRAVFSKCLNAETGEYHIIFLPWREPLWALNGMQKSEEEKLEAVKRKYVNAKLYVISENIKRNITYIMYVLRGSCGYLWPSTEKEKVKLALYNFLCIITTTRCSLEFTKWLNRAPFGPIFAHNLRFCLVCSILKACHIWHQLVCLV